MKGVESNGKEKERFDLQKELLAALFNAPERLEEPELPRRRIVRSTKGYGAYGHLVLQPPNDSLSECKTPVVYQQHHTEDGMHPFLYTGVSLVPYLLRRIVGSVCLVNDIRLLGIDSVLIKSKLRLNMDL